MLHLASGTLSVVQDGGADVTRIAVLSAAIVQAVGQVVLAGVGFAAWVLYRRRYLALLAASWLAMAVYQANGSVSIALGSPAGSAWRQALSLVASLASFLQIGWLALGVYGLSRNRETTKRVLAWVTIPSLVTGLVVWSATLSSSPATRYEIRVALRGALAALVFLGSAVIVLRYRRHGLGRWLVVVGFFTYAVNLLQYAALLLPGYGFTRAIPLGYVDILAQMIIGLGLVISMLEDERERATQSAHALEATHHKSLHSSKMEALGRMAGGVSHDFNNLLTAMRGHLELALERTEPDDGRRLDLEQAWRAAERACHLTQQLLSFSRARTVNFAATCDVVATLREIQPLLQRLVGQAIQVEYDLPEQAAAATIDRTGLEQVIFNLAANARDAMPSGGRLWLRVRVQPPARGVGPTIAVQVQDEGCGMDDATRARIFDPFFTTKPPGFGTGLGLAQVYGIVQQAHGQIDCASVPGRGTTFTLILPASNLPIDAIAPISEPPAAAPAVEKVRDQVVMLVDDDPLVRQLLCRSLREQGYTVIEAGDPVEALALEAEFDEPIQLLITDLAMPKLSGTELASRICQRRPTTRLLFITGYSASHTPSPDVELLHKPFSQATFLACVERLLAKAGTASKAPSGASPTT